MDIVVVVRQLADLVEELEVNDEGTDIDRDFVKFVANEWDEAALEEALCLKEAVGGTVTVVALDEPDVDQTLYAAAAKGADRIVKLTGHDPDGWVRTRERAARVAAWLRDQHADVVLTGVQAADDLDGQIAGVVASYLGWPHAAVVVGVDPVGNELRVTQELGGGTVAMSSLTMPAVLGIQAARQAPRYAPISRIRQAQQSTTIEEVEIDEPAIGAVASVRRLFPPPSRGGAEMLEGSAAEVADKIVEILRARGLVRA